MERKTEVLNAIIRSTTLGYEDHNIFTFMLHLEGDGWGCGFGGYAMDTWSKEQDKRLPTAFGMACVCAVLQTLELDSWEKLPGTAVRAVTEGLGGRIVRLGHLIKDRWFNVEELAAAYGTGAKKTYEEEKNR